MLALPARVADMIQFWFFMYHQERVWVKGVRLGPVERVEIGFRHVRFLYLPVQLTCRHDSQTLTPRTTDIVLELTFEQHAQCSIHGVKIRDRSPNEWICHNEKKYPNE